MSGNSLAVTFVRGARRVTGSNFLIEATDGERHTRILVDCGLTQGERFCDPANAEPFPYDPTSIDAIFFTHAHADHIGLFPKLVKDGFTGAAYATSATRELMPVMLEDSVALIGDEAKRCGYQAPYTASDVSHAVSKIQDLAYHKTLSIGPFSVTLYNAGHILGSATVCIEAFGKKILFTGDLGRTPAALVPDPEIPGEVDYLVTESVYGNRLHAPLADAKAVLKHAVERAQAERGTLLIPSFSLERTQILLDALKESPIPVFLDSPLSEKVTAVYNRFPEYLRTPLSFAFQPFTEADEKISPKIIIAGSGMSHGGRIRRHETRYLPDPKTTLLIVGYQTAGSLGRRLKDGARKVEIDGQWVTARAKIMSTDGFSAHADQDDLMHFAESVKPKKAFVVLGETESATFLAQRISGFYGIETAVPREGERQELL